MLHEQSFNIALAHALRARRSAWRRDDDAVLCERLHTLIENAAARPDILIQSPRSFPVAIEVEFGKPAINDARGRLGKRSEANMLPIRSAIAVGVPDELRSCSDYELERQLQSDEEIELSFVLLAGDVTEDWNDVADQDVYRWSEIGFVTGNVSDLAALCDAAPAPPSLVERHSELIATEMAGYANALKSALSDDAATKIAETLGQKSVDQGLRLACCIWMTSFKLQDLLARTDAMAEAGLKSVNAMRQASSMPLLTVSDIRDAWTIILNINYRSIFTPVLNALHADIPALNGAEILDGLARVAERVSALRLGDSVDFAGELFPKLIDDREETAAHYTLPETATLLAHAALQRIGVSDWANKDEATALRIADLACGTGTLLRSAYSRIRQKHEAKGGSANELHRRMMEESITGLDVNALASHMTAAALSSAEMATEYQTANIGAVAIPSGKTGSLELLISDQITDVTGETARAATTDRAEPTNFEVPNGSQDLVIQNPPYLRPRGGRKLFDIAGITEPERQRSVKRLGSIRSALRRQGNEFINGQAGLGTDFSALAHMKLKSGGVFASVLPLTAAHANTWSGFRKEVESHHSNITAIAVASDETAMMSADTHMNEMLIISRKNGDSDIPEECKRILSVNLHHAPRLTVEASYIARAISEAEKSEDDYGTLAIANVPVGSWVRMPIIRYGFPWYAVSMRDHNLAKVMANFMDDKLYSPRDMSASQIKLEVVCLDRIAETGPTHDLIGHLRGKDPRGAFTFDRLRPGDVPVLSSLWSVETNEQSRIIIKPTHNGEPVHGRERLQRAMLEQRSDLFISRNLRMTSQSLAAAHTRHENMGGPTWTGLIHSDNRVKNALSIWLNSTLGLLVRWGYAQTTQPGRARLQIKAIDGLPVPNFIADSPAGERARQTAQQHFDSLAHLELQPASYAFRDSNRHRIDAVSLEMLGLKDDERAHRAVADIRALWCLEPSVHGSDTSIMQAIEHSQ